MPTFPSKRYRPASYAKTLPARYRAELNKHPFLLFGLPFLVTVVAGSFFLTPATAIRYEKHDRKMRQLTKEEELGIGQNRRKVDMKEEYYVSVLPARSGAAPPPLSSNDAADSNIILQRLAAKDLSDWEQRRVKRLPGEPDGIL